MLSHDTVSVWSVWAKKRKKERVAHSKNEFLECATLSFFFKSYVPLVCTSLNFLGVLHSCINWSVGAVGSNTSNVSEIVEVSAEAQESTGSPEFFFFSSSTALSLAFSLNWSDNTLAENSSARAGRGEHMKTWTKRGVGHSCSCQEEPQ